MNTMKAHSKGECPQKDLLRLEDYEGVRRKKMKIVHLEKR
jgi:hypothetical protein